MIHTIIYDFDGTIVNTAHPYAIISAAQFQKMAEEQQCGQFGRDSLVDFLARPDITGLGTHDKLKKTHDEFGIDLTPWHKEMSQRLRPLKKQIYENTQTSLCPNIDAAFAAFAKKGYRQAVASSNTQELLDQAAERFGLSRYCGANIYSSKPNEPKKPEPHLLLRTAINVRSHWSNCAYVGDALSDIIAAKKAGMLAIAYYPNAESDAIGKQAFIDAGADIICSDFKLLAPAIEHYQRRHVGPSPQ